MGKCMVAAVLFALSACGPSQAPVRISDHHNVCANLSSGSRLHEVTQGPDFDVATLDIDGTTVEVYVGGHPRFSHRVMKRGEGTVDGFVFLGKEKSDDQEKILLGHDRQEGRGPIFVMFAGVDLQSVEQVLIKQNFIVNCTHDS